MINKIKEFVRMIKVNNSPEFAMKVANNFCQFNHPEFGKRPFYHVNSHFYLNRDDSLLQQPNLDYFQQQYLRLRHHQNTESENPKLYIQIFWREQSHKF